MGNWPGPAGDARQPTGRRLLDETDAVPAVLTHTARDGRDYWTDGTVGNTACEGEIVKTLRDWNSLYHSYFLTKRKGRMAKHI